MHLRPRQQPAQVPKKKKTDHVVKKQSRENCRHQPQSTSPVSSNKRRTCTKIHPSSHPPQSISIQPTHPVPHAIKQHSSSPSPLVLPSPTKMTAITLQNSCETSTPIGHPKKFYALDPLVEPTTDPSPLPSPTFATGLPTPFRPPYSQRGYPDSTNPL